MAIIRFQNIQNPFERLLSLQNELERYFERDLFHIPKTTGRGLFPPINLFEKDNGFTVTMELPGFSEKDINIEVVDKQVVVSGKRTVKVDNENITYHRKEREWGEFSRSFTLPDKVDSEKVKATLKNGILTIKVAKAEEVIPKQITINVE